MSQVSQRRVRMHVLAAATAVALSSMAAGSAFAAGRVELGGLQPRGQHDRFIVKYRAGSSERANAAVMQASLTQAARAVAAANGRVLAVKRQRRLAVGADVVKADRKLDRVEAESLMRQIAANPAVEYVEVDSLMRPVLTPNDPRYVDQWGYNDADAGIRANQAWDVNTGTGIIVAVLDTGITVHSDLNDNLVAGYDFIIDTAVSNDGNGRDPDPSDPGDAVGGAQSSWHGTHVTGTVAAETNNSVGVAGTAFGAKVMPVRVLGVGGGYLSDIADAIVWSSGGVVGGVPTLPAADAADVINMSLGGSGICGTTYQTAIDSAVGRGTTVVVAAGNSNSDVANFRPASCNNVVAVASVTSSSSRSSFSNFGAKIDVSAPGSGIWSTLNNGVSAPGAEAYASYSGTSMASPHVAGTVALVQSRRLALALPLYTPAQVEALLKSTAYALSGTCTGGCGAGIVNAKAAVDAAGGVVNTPPVANFSFTVNGLIAAFTDASTDTDGTIASRSWAFGDGTSSTATNPSHTYATGGTYNVTLTVLDNGGASHSTTKAVTIASTCNRSSPSAFCKDNGSILY